MEAAGFALSILSVRWLREQPLSYPAAMCNLYGLKVTRWELIAYYKAQDSWRREIGREEMGKDYVSPGREGWVVTQDGDGRHVTKMNWGFRSDGSCILRTSATHEPMLIVQCCAICRSSAGGNDGTTSTS